MVSGLIPPEMLQMCIQEASVQFDQYAYWVRQQYDANGDPIENSYSEKQYDEPTPIPARAVKIDREFIDEHGYHVIAATQWYIPPNTGVRYGDKIYGVGDDPANLPPIMSVGEVPDPGASIYELVTTGWRSKGAP